MAHSRKRRLAAKLIFFTVALGLFGAIVFVNFREAEARRERRSQFDILAEAQLREFLAHQSDGDYQQNLAESLVRLRAAKGDKDYSLQDAHAMLKLLLDSLSTPDGFDAARDRLALALKAKERGERQQAPLRAAEKARPKTTFAEAMEEMAIRAEASHGK